MVVCLECRTYAGVASFDDGVVWAVDHMATSHPERRELRVGDVGVVSID